MIYVLNLLVIIYLVLMFYYWGSIQGLLSAFLHLVLTIVAGTIALALWEPITVGFLLNYIPGSAWCVGLLLPFAVILIVLRVAADKLVSGNMRFHPVVNVIAGGFCGLWAGVLISGLTIIAMGFLPMGSEFMGYQPLKLNDTGQVDPNGGPGTLWVSVDRRAAAFFTTLSGGALSPGFGDQPDLARYRPDLAMEPCLTRLSREFDEHSLVTTAPGKITVERVYSRTGAKSAVELVDAWNLAYEMRRRLDMKGDEVPKDLRGNIEPAVKDLEAKLKEPDRKAIDKAVERVDAWNVIGAARHAMTDAKEISSEKRDKIESAIKDLESRLADKEATDLANKIKDVSEYAKGLSGGTGGLHVAIADHLPQELQDSDKLVIVDTEWTKGPELYDGQILRVPPTQIRLIAWQGEKRHEIASVLQPIGVTDRETATGPRQFWQLRNDRKFYPNTQASKGRFGWVFALSAQEQPKFLLARDMRLDLRPEEGGGKVEWITDDDAAVVVALGHYVASTTQPASDTGVETGTPGPNPTKYKDIELSNALPMRTTRVAASRLNATEGQTGIDSGDQDGIKPNLESGRVDKDILLDHINFPTNATSVRVQIGAEERSLLGSAISRAKLLSGLALVDDKNEKHYPMAWVKYNRQNYVQDIHVEFQEITNATEFKIPSMSLEQDLYIYFPILKGTHLVKYELGNAQTKEIDLTIP